MTKENTPSAEAMEKAHKILAGAGAYRIEDHSTGPWSISPMRLAAALDAFAAEARADQKEWDAKIAESMYQRGQIGSDIAAAIREQK